MRTATPCRGNREISRGAPPASCLPARPASSSCVVSPGATGVVVVLDEVLGE